MNDLDITRRGETYGPDGTETPNPNRERHTMSYTVNRVILVGEVGNDPDEVRRADGGRVAHLSLATRREENGETRTDWHRVTVNGELLAGANGFVRRGCRLYVEGRIMYGSWDRDGISIPTADIIATDIVVLRRAT